MNVGIYIHVPFCLRKCPYCDFYSVKYEADTVQKYVDAVCRNIREYKGRGITADTVYFGGGTPSLLSPQQIRCIINAAAESFRLDFPEITIEANPCTVDYEKLLGYKEAGINRISFGVQSADDSQLEFLGRLHDFETAKSAVFNAKKAGFENISCDIMLGLAGQDMESLCKTIDRLTDLPINHISSYMLKIESGTKFDNDDIRRAVANEDLQCDMYLKSVELLEGKGFEQYEISNFAKSGKYSRHNLKYWKCGEYIGIGPGAHSYFEEKRFYVPKNLEDFISDKFQTEIVTENHPDRLEEYVMLSLRLKWGISIKRLTQLGGEKLAAKIAKKAEIFARAGLCKTDDDRIWLTPNGFLVSNSIIGTFLEQ